jgi:hypothetical protein
MLFSCLASVAFTICLCRRPTKKPVVAASVPAVKHEWVSDVEFGPASQVIQSKGKARARLGSPVIVSSDESGSDQFFDTPKAKGRLSVNIPKSVKKQQYVLGI